MYSAFSVLHQISPFPYDLVDAECRKYSNAELMYVQEEQKNMGAWSYVQPRIQNLMTGQTVRYCDDIRKTEFPQAPHHHVGVIQHAIQLATKIAQHESPVSLKDAKCQI